jgi:hypothetical protein
MKQHRMRQAAGIVGTLKVCPDFGVAGNTVECGLHAWLGGGTSLDGPGSTGGGGRFARRRHNTFTCPPSRGACNDDSSVRNQFLQGAVTVSQPKAEEPAEGKARESQLPSWTIVAGFADGWIPKEGQHPPAPGTSQRGSTPGVNQGEWGWGLMPFVRRRN